MKKRPVRLLRESLGLSQAAFALELAADQPLVSVWENGAKGRTGRLDVSTVRKLQAVWPRQVARILRVHELDLLDLLENQPIDCD